VKYPIVLWRCEKCGCDNTIRLSRCRWKIVTTDKNHPLVILDCEGCGYSWFIELGEEEK